MMETFDLLDVQGAVSRQLYQYVFGIATSQHDTSHWPEPLVELYNQSITKLDSNCKEQLHVVLDKYVGIFAKSPYDMG